jgi:hypothetical protein
MTDRDRAELQTLLDQFHQSMARENGVLLDHEAKHRIGEMVGRAVHSGEFGYLRNR